MPPLLSTLIYLLLLLLLPVKILIGFLSVKKTDRFSRARSTTLLSIMSSISIFFCIYFLLLNAAGIKGSLILKKWGVIHHLTACFLFFTNIALDILLLLYTADPNVMADVTTIMLGIASGVYGLFWLTYIIYAMSLGTILQDRLRSDLDSANSSLGIRG